MSAPDVEHKKRPERYVVTKDVRLKILKLLRNGLGIHASVRAAGVSYTAFCDYRSTHPKFRERVNAAKNKGLDIIEELMEDMARNKNLTAMFGILRANRPEKWRDNANVTGKITHEHSFPAAFSHAMAEETHGTARQATH